MWAIEVTEHRIAAAGLVAKCLRTATACGSATAQGPATHRAAGAERQAHGGKGQR